MKNLIYKYLPYEANTEKNEKTFALCATDPSSFSFKVHFSLPFFSGPLVL